MLRAAFLSTAISFILMASAQAQDQDDFPNLEAGVYFTILNLPSVHEIPGGFGGRFGHNISRWIGIDSEFTYFPVKDTTQCVHIIDNRMTGSPCSSKDTGVFGETQMLAGLKAGIRTEKVGIFGKIRPGFIHFSDRQHMEYFNNPSKWRFALDIGGVLEFYLNSAAAIRIDFGETLINFGGWRSIGGYPSQKTTNHGFQAGAGIMLGF